MKLIRGIVLIVVSLLFLGTTWWLWRYAPLIDQDCRYRLRGDAAAFFGVVYFAETANCAPLAPGMEDLAGLPAVPRRVFALDFFIPGIIFLAFGIRDVRRNSRSSRDLTSGPPSGVY